MGLLSGLEKFGLDIKGDLDITATDKDKDSKKPEKSSKKEMVKLDEKDLVLKKTVTCPVCDYQFKTLTTKTGRAKKLEPDRDLRPNHEGIDTLKYDVCSCPRCGYTAMHKYFDHVSSMQIRWLRDAVCSKFTPTEEKDYETYTYDESVDFYKLALVCSIAKHSKLSEKALVCLRISWLRRAQIADIKKRAKEEAAAHNGKVSLEMAEEFKSIENLKSEQDAFYKQAYDGFMKATSEETPPYAGMDEKTVDYLLANMAVYFKEYSTASKLVSTLLQSPNTPSRVKDMCMDLKDEIVNAVKQQKNN